MIKRSTLDIGLVTREIWLSMMTERSYLGAIVARQGGEVLAQMLILEEVGRTLFW